VFRCVQTLQHLIDEIRLFNRYKEMALASWLHGRLSLKSVTRIAVAVNDSIVTTESRDTMDLRFSICCFKNHLVDDLVNISEQLYIRLTDEE
jgi:hypothetical protein